MPARESFRPAFIDRLILAVLFVLAVAQPLLELLRSTPEFFVARKSDPIDIVALTVVLSVLFPALLAFAAWILFRIHRYAGILFFSGMFVLFTILLVIPLLKKTGVLSGSVLVPLAGIIAIGFFFFVQRYELLRSLLQWSGLLILIVPALFLISMFRAGLLQDRPSSVPLSKVSATVPIVFLLLDELPLTSLLDTDGNIDAGRFPNFARFQKESVWFRNATTVADGTPEAIAGILSGKYPAEGKVPILQHYPDNLFTLLGGSYDIEALEHVSKLSPHGPLLNNDNSTIVGRFKLLLLDLSAIYLHIVTPDELRGHLPSIQQTWGNFWMLNEGDDLVKYQNPYSAREKQFEAFLKIIAPSKKPTLYFQHIFLPHVPWSFLPSGKEYDHTGYGPMGVEGMSVLDEIWTRDEWVVLRGYQRHLLQVCYVDRMIGMLVDRLKEQNLYDAALVVITADHGSSYRPGDRVRTLTATNYTDIVSVPVFMKLPGSSQERIVDANFETIDILPTIADALGIKLPFTADGVSAFRDGPDRSRKRVLKTIFSRDAWFEYDPDLKSKRSASVNRKVRFFGVGSSEALYDPMRLQTDSSSGAVGASWTNDEGVRFELKNPASFEQVDLNSSFIPVFIVGRALFTAPRSDPLVIGIWVNGVFRGRTRTFLPDKNVQGWLRTLWLRSSTGLNARLEEIHGFGLIVPESSFRQGRNEIEIRVLK